VWSHQIKHFNKICNTLENHLSYVDVSIMGSGKSFLCLAFCIYFNLDLGIVCPKSVEDNWNTIGQTYGIKIKFIISYHGLRGNKKYPPTHGLLNRVDGNFTTTEYFKKLVKGRLLLIFDEFHNIKNDNDTFLASYTLVKEIINLSKQGHASRIGLLSATPFDKKEQSVSALKMLGIISQDKLYEYDKNSKLYELYGIKEAINKCYRINPDTTYQITAKTINRNTIGSICHDLYTQVIKAVFVSAMPLKQKTVNGVVTKKIVRDAKNGYYNMSCEDVLKISNGISLLTSAVKYKLDSDDVNKNCWNDITTALVMIESGKIDTPVRLIEQDLTNNPKAKAIIYFNYIDHIELAAKKLKKYNPLVMYGKTSKKRRKEIIELFQQSNMDCRVLISNPKVGGVGIELDDKHGDFIRYMYIIPTYNYLDLHQAAGRTFRQGTKSDTIIRFIYSKDYPHETSILNAIARKRNIVRDIIIDEDKSILLPGEYESYIED
jgi:superfamily II DNA or RNA helicase